MALANKNHVTAGDSTMAIIQASAAFYEHNFGGPENVYGIDHHEPESPEKAGWLGKNNFTMSNSSSVSSPSSTSSNGLGYQQEGHSVISFKPDYANFVHGNGTSSLLSFDQNKKGVARNLFPKMMGDEDDDYPMWDEDMPTNNYQMDPSSTTTTNHGPPETSSSHYAASGYGSPSSGVQFAWMNDQMANNIQEIGKQETTNNKRPSTGESIQDLKKQCVVDTSSSPAKKAKAKSVSPAAKDPQSLAAKNRRERISERLKILQDLVPNGSKVDLVTMLEKAISYVKFLQLQVKVLATDEFWPTQGGKAPDISQVREAIDAILASQRDRNSSSK